MKDKKFIKKIFSFLFFSFIFAAAFPIDFYVKDKSKQFSDFDDDYDDWAKSQLDFYNSALSEMKAECAKFGVNVVETSDSEKFPYLDYRIEEGYEEQTELAVSVMYNKNEKRDTYVYYSVDDKSESASFAAKFFVGVARSCLDSSAKKSEPPLFVDSFVPSEIFGKKLPAEERRAKIQNCVVGKDDGTFVFAEGKTLRHFDANGNLISDLSAKIDDGKSDSKRNAIRSFWKVGYDGNRIFYGTPESRDMYVFDDNDEVSSFECGHELSSMNHIRFGKNGEPFIINFMNKEVVFPKKDSASVVYTKDSIHNYYLFVAADGKMWKRIDIPNANYVMVYSPEGNLEKVYILRGENNGTFQYAFEDSSFIVKVTDENKKTFLRKCDSLGRVVWSLELPKENSNAEIQDIRGGIYYLFDSSFDSLIRLADSSENLPPFMKTIAECNLNLMKNPSSYENVLKIAESYDAAGGKWLAFEKYCAYLKKSPGNAKAAEKKLQAQIALEKSDAKELSDAAFALYDEYGAETAREKYQDAMKTIERLKKLSPNDEEIASMYAELKNTFYPENAVSSKMPSLHVDAVEIAPIFPAKLNMYAKKPNGVLYVSNPTNKTLKNVKVNSFVRKYMDFPSESEVIAELKPNASAVPIMLFSQINASALSVSEDTSVQMQFTVSYEEDGKKNTLSLNRPVTIYKKSAMDWGDLDMISCFVLPNDENVSSFVFDNVKDDDSPAISLQVKKAMQVANALGSIPLNYISDPVTPAKDQVGNKYAIDTVRFPFETLSKKGGDCDDMSTLLCSVLESAGVSCALVTTPAHIFVAFDSGLKRGDALEKVESSTKLRFIPKDFCPDEKKNNLWIPVEATSLGDGFYKSWEIASGEISDKLSGECKIEEFSVLEYAKVEYPPVNVDSKKANVSSRKKVSADMNSASSNLMKDCFVGVLDSYVATARNPKELNRVAKYYFSLGEREKSIEALNVAAKIDPKYRSTFVNLAAVYKSLGEESKYKEFVAKANSVSEKYSLKISATGDNALRAASSSEFEWEE
ncbi:MAG: hypothetical protein IKP49_01420 [Treponema sp.]|nr:hypothetical protein [Treponema sp.]